MLRCNTVASSWSPEAIPLELGVIMIVKTVDSRWLAPRPGGPLPLLDRWLDLSVLASLPCDENCLGQECSLTLADSEH
jgi:hypothetical protein